jgi:hypothetical protein
MEAHPQGLADHHCSPYGKDQGGEMNLSVTVLAIPKGTSWFPTLLWKKYPCLTQYAIVAVRNNDEGIGSPSKYLDFPLASAGMRATVALNLASRARPHDTNHNKQMVSSGVRSPRVKARMAGATPKEMRSARESISCPSIDPPPLHRATLPSRASNPNPRIGRRWAK